MYASGPRLHHGANDTDDSQHHHDADDKRQELVCDEESDESGDHRKKRKEGEVSMMTQPGRYYDSTVLCLSGLRPLYSRPAFRSFFLDNAVQSMSVCRSPNGITWLRQPGTVSIKVVPLPSLDS